MSFPLNPGARGVERLPGLLTLGCPCGSVTVLRQDVPYYPVRFRCSRCRRNWLVDSPLPGHAEHRWVDRTPKEHTDADPAPA